MPAEGAQILLPCRKHGLVAADVVSDRVLGQSDGVRVEQLPADLGDRPVSSEATVSDPTENVAVHRCSCVSLSVSWARAATVTNEGRWVLHGAVPQLYPHRAG